VIRNFAWSADEVDLQPRPDNFATVSQHLAREKIDVVFAAFGFNESFGGKERIGEFRARLAAYLDDLRTSSFNGETPARVVLVSPTANENIPGVPAADLNNGRLALYTSAMAEIAANKGVAFADVFAGTRDALADPDSTLTINGVHFTAEGYRIFARQLFRETFEESPPRVNEAVRAVAIDKNRQYFRRYRPLNPFYYTGGRNEKYGYLDFLPAMRNFEILTANRERRAWRLARGEDVSGPIDDSNAPPLEAVAEAIGANEWLAPADELASFDVDPRFEVNLFASEEEFPEIACPIQLRWDGRGRLWVSCSTTYPHVYPGEEPRDRIVILEDTSNWIRFDVFRQSNGNLGVFAASTLAQVSTQRRRSQRGRLSSTAGSAGASAATRRNTALTSPASGRRRARASATLVATAACAGVASTRICAAPSRKRLCATRASGA